MVDANNLTPHSQHEFNKIFTSILSGLIPGKATRDNNHNQLLKREEMDQREGNDIESDEGLLEKELQSNGSSSFWEEKELGMEEPLLLRKRTLNTTSQIAVVGANVCPIESLDYEIVENDLYKEDWRQRKKVQIFQYIVLKWAFALLIGLGTGLVGFFNNLAVENIAGFKLLLTSNLMLKRRLSASFVTSLWKYY